MFEAVWLWMTQRVVFARSHLEAFELLELPCELIEEIADKLSYHDRCALACCCSQLRALGDAQAYWQRVLQLPGLVPILEAGRSARWYRRCQWKDRFRKLLGGSRFKCQVFNRELDNTAEDFLLSAYDATASLLSLAGDDGAPVFEVRYLAMSGARGGDGAVVERVGLERLRPVPAASTPYRVFRSTLEGIQVDDDVELQWKGMASHPFGWWLGRVVDIQQDCLAIMFRQYPEHSPWRVVVAPWRPGRETLVNWDDRYGYVGGIRKLSEAEQQQWAGQVQAVAQMAVPAAAQSSGRSPDEEGEGEQQGEQPQEQLLPPPQQQQQQQQEQVEQQQAQQQQQAEGQQ